MDREKIQTMTDGLSDDGLLAFYNSCCPQSPLYLINNTWFLELGEEEKKTATDKAQDQWAKRLAGLTEDQQFRLNQLLKGETK